MAFSWLIKGGYYSLTSPGMIPEVPAIQAKWSSWRVVWATKKKNVRLSIVIVHGCLLGILVGYSNPLYPYRQQIISFFFIAHVKRITYPLCHSWVGTSPIINPSEKECDIIKILSSFPTWICFLGGWKASKNIPQMVMAHIVIYHGFESPKKSTNFSQIQVRPAIFVSSVQVT